MRRPGGCGTSGLGLGEQSIDVRLGRDEMPDAELARLGWPERYPRVFGELCARVQSQNEVPVEVEHRNVSGRELMVALELGRDDPLRVQSEALAVEGERTIEIGYSQRDHMEARFHVPQSVASA